ncbi:nucleoside transporter-domain-containing protein [Pisolithus marmoratus]|nr:nucleoside transporter-domain-containing protein [Pisolithus marmoratus]
MAAINESTVYQAVPTSEDHTGSGLSAGDPPLTRDPPLSTAPVDKRIRWTYFLLGCATLLSWDALINAVSFFKSRLVGTPMRAVFSSYQSSAFTATGLLFQTYCTMTSKQSSPSRRVLGSILILTFFLFLFFLSTLTQVNPSIFFSFVLVCSIAMSASGVYLSTAVYAGAALLGGPYIQSTVSGQAAIAVIVSTVELISSTLSVWGASPEAIATFIAEDGVGDGKTEESAARIFFGASVLFMAFVFAASVWLTKQPLYKSTVGLLDHQLKASEVAEDDEERHGLVSSRQIISSPSPSSDLWRVFKTNLSFMFSTAYIFITTLAIFPAITSTVLPTNPGIHPLLFVDAHFLIFNVGDLLGRYVCSFPRMVVWSADKILAMSLLRTLFIPIILFCNVQRAVEIPPVIGSDALYMLILLALGLSNGYVFTLSLLAVSSLQHNHRLQGYGDVDIAATLCALAIVLGLAVGSLLSFGVRAAICNCNPFRL